MSIGFFALYNVGSITRSDKTPVFSQVTVIDGPVQRTGATGPIILKTAASPRKARKTRNKSVCCVKTDIHPFGDNSQLSISLNIFVLFVFFVDQMIFLG